MCGICGIFNLEKPGPVSGELLKKMNGLLAHRGPDDEGYYCDDRAGLAMRRLSIIDLSSGHQPISNEDGTVWVILNGEIYNFQELRNRLEAKGHIFKTKTDTEIVAHLYEDLGTGCVKELRGMFALAIWDKAAKRGMLARDRIGKKPLVYAHAAGRLAFASELRSLLVLDWVSRDMDFSALDLYMSLMYIPSPRTIFKSINKLPPGHVMIMENGGIKIERYWDLPLKARTPPMDFEEAKGEIVERLREAVRLRLISDVPLGAFLSGGIDSSVIVALMSELSEKPVRTFSIGFDEAEFSELRYAREVAKQYGCDHNEFTVKPEMSDVLPKLAWHYGEPYADPSALPSYYVARETRKYVTVALNGDGGDENFAGYKRYAAMKLAAVWDLLPGAVRRAIAAMAGPLPEKTAPSDVVWQAKRFLRAGAEDGLAARHLAMSCFFRDEQKPGLYSGALKKELSGNLHAALGYFTALFDSAGSVDFINRLLYADFKSYLPECLMAKMDIATMANSLEGRSPLLDHKFVEFVFPLPGEWKLKGLSKTKWIFKEAFKDKLPPLVRNRGKQGFGIPLGPWFRGELKSYWEERCLAPGALNRGYFNEDAVRKFWLEHQSGKRDHGFRLWSFLMLELWHEAYAPGQKI